LQVADEPSPEAIPKALKSSGNVHVLSLQFVYSPCSVKHRLTLCVLIRMSSHEYENLASENLASAPCFNAVPNVDEHDDRSKPPLIQQRGRFKVTPGHVELDKVIVSH
jgi:hypothetical protein